MLNLEKTLLELKNEVSALKRRVLALEGRKGFVPPSPDDLRTYADEIGFTDFDPLEFLDFYDSKGWKVGNAPMKNWKAAVRTWKKRQTGVKSNHETERAAKIAEAMKYQ